MVDALVYRRPLARRSARLAAALEDMFHDLLAGTVVVDAE